MSFQLVTADPGRLLGEVLLVAAGAVTVLLAPIMAKVIHVRQHLRATRRSMIMTICAYGCLGVGTFCLAVALASPSRLAFAVLLVAYGGLMFAYFGLQTLAFRWLRQELHALHPNSTDESP